MHNGISLITYYMHMLLLFLLLLPNNLHRSAYCFAWQRSEVYYTAYLYIPSILFVFLMNKT